MKEDFLFLLNRWTTFLFVIVTALCVALLDSPAASQEFESPNYVFTTTLLSEFGGGLRRLNPGYWADKYFGWHGEEEQTKYQLQLTDRVEQAIGSYGVGPMPASLIDTFGASGAGAITGYDPVTGQPLPWNQRVIGGSGLLLTTAGALKGAGYQGGYYKGVGLRSSPPGGMLMGKNGEFIRYVDVKQVPNGPTSAPLPVMQLNLTKNPPRLEGKTLDGSYPKSLFPVAREDFHKMYPTRPVESLPPGCNIVGPVRVGVTNEMLTPLQGKVNEVGRPLAVVGSRQRGWALWSNGRIGPWSGSPTSDLDFFVLDISDFENWWDALDGPAFDALKDLGVPLDHQGVSGIASAFEALQQDGFILYPSTDDILPPSFPGIEIEPPALLPEPEIEPPTIP